jgi:hypothetical protein
MKQVYTTTNSEHRESKRAGARKFKSRSSTPGKPDVVQQKDGNWDGGGDVAALLFALVITNAWAETSVVLIEVS